MVRNGKLIRHGSLHMEFFFGIIPNHNISCNDVIFFENKIMKFHRDARELTSESKNQFFRGTMRGRKILKCLGGTNFAFLEAKSLF